MEGVLLAAVVYNVLAYVCDNEMQKAMCGKYRLPFQEELYFDINYSPERSISSSSAKVGW